MNFHLFIWNPGGESDEETVEADERSSDIDIVEKHVSRDSVSVQSVTEPSTEKLER